MLILKILLAIIGSVIAFSLVVILVIYVKFRKMLRNNGFGNLDSIREMINKSESEAITRHKSISGLTKVKLPQIIKDFPELSESTLFSKVETSLLTVFNSISEKKITDNKILGVLKYSLMAEFESMRLNNITKSYSNIHFHQHVIKDYQINSGAAVITIASSLEYNYEELKGNKVVKEYMKNPKQTSYITKFVYILDETEYDDSVDVIGIHCPNCGAPIRSIGKNKVCEYCNSGYKDINIRAWFISYYKEDVR